MDCVTPSNPNGLHIEYGIPQGLICINILCLTHYSVGFDCPYKSVYDQTNFIELSADFCTKTSAIPGCSSLRSKSMVYGDCCVWPQNGMEFESSCSYWTAMTFELRDLSVSWSQDFFRVGFSDGARSFELFFFHILFYLFIHFVEEYVITIVLVNSVIKRAQISN